MEDLLKTLAETPLPHILVIAGLLFLFLSIAGKIGANIAVNSEKQRLAGVLGFILLVGGVTLYLFVPSTPTGITTPTHTPMPKQKHKLTPPPESKSPTSMPSIKQPDIIKKAREHWLWGDYDAALNGFEAILQKSDDQAARELAETRSKWLNKYRGHIIFADDFEDDTISTGARWLIHPPGPGTGTGSVARIKKDGNFVLEGRGHYHAAAKISDDVVNRDFEIKLRFQPETLEQDAAHINIMMDEIEGRSTIGIHIKGNELSIWEEKSGRETGKVYRQKFSLRWYELRAVITGARIQVFLDDMPVLDYTSPRSQVFLKEFNIEPLAGVLRFDDVLVISR